MPIRSSKGRGEVQIAAAGRGPAGCLRPPDLGPGAVAWPDGPGRAQDALSWPSWQAGWLPWRRSPRPRERPARSLKGLVMTIYQHIRHPRIAARSADRPVKVADLFPRGTAVTRFNTKVALLITAVVGSMWCAYAFALFDLISLPAAIRGGASAIVSWVAQTFLQLVLLSVIMVGQNVQAAAADKRAERHTTTPAPLCTKWRTCKATSPPRTSC